MENKKYLPLKVIHSIFMIIGLCFYAFSLIEVKNTQTDTSWIISAALQSSSAILVLLSGLLYLTHGYKHTTKVLFGFF